MRRTILHSNVEVVMILTLCSNFQVFAHFALQSSLMKLYFLIFVLQTFSWNHSSIYFVCSPLSSLETYWSICVTCVVKGMLLDIELSLWHALVLQPQISNFPYSLKNLYSVWNYLSLKNFTLSLNEAHESALFLFSSTHSTFCCSAKIK